MPAENNSRFSTDAPPRGSLEIGSARAAIGRRDELEERALAAAAAKLIRRGAIVIAFFNLLVLGSAPLWGISKPPMFVVWGCINSALAFAFAAMTFRGWFRRHWRIAALILCAELLTSATISYTLLGNTDALLLDLSLLVIGAGALIPWAPKWQALLGSLALLAAGVNFAATPSRESAPAEHVFGLIFSIVIAQLITSLNQYYRREIARALAELQESHDRLQVEMALREQASGERAAAQAKLRESEQALRRIFDAALDIIVVNRLSDAAYVDANRAFHTTGYTLDELQERANRGSGIWASDAQRRDVWRELRGRGYVHNVEAKLSAKDGTVRTNLVSAVAVDLHGEPCAVFFVRDITEIKQAEQKLADSEQMLRRVFDASLDAISITRASDGRYVDVNREFLARWPDRGAVIGSTDLELGVWVHPEQRNELSLHLAKDGVVRNFEVDFYTSDRRVESHLLSAAVLELRGEPCVVAFTRNISLLKNTQLELIEAREAALAASRAKSEFLSSMSHEIRTPLNSILGMADLLTETDVSLEQRHLVNTMVSNGNALLQIINDILDLAR
ncbi:MAG: PAS domain S-box protein, partial [Candidatus Binataceae bacterium]